MLMFLLAVLLSAAAMVLWHVSSDEALNSETEALPTAWFTPMKIGCTVLLVLAFLALHSLFGPWLGLLVWLVLQALGFFVLTNYVPRTDIVRLVKRG